MIDFDEPTELAVGRSADIAEIAHAAGHVVKIHVDHVGQFEDDFLRSDDAEVLRVECAGSFACGLTIYSPEVAFNDIEEWRQLCVLLRRVVYVVIHC